MITINKNDEIWVEFDDVMNKVALPGNAITVKMIMEKYNCSPSTARRKMDLAKAQGFISGICVCNGTRVRYICPPEKE